MDPKVLHDLSIAYAQARLSRKQYNSKEPHSKEELYDFIHDYHFARNNIVEQSKQLPRI